MIKDLTTLKEPDLYSLSMFTLYKLVDIPEYSSISELSYILDKTNLLKLCEYFGGTTIKIPTLNDGDIFILCFPFYFSNAHV